MDPQERKVIDQLFDKLDQAERQSGPPEPIAQAHIRSRVEKQPGAPYLMAQTIVIQEHALAAAQARIAGLEAELARRPAAGGGFLSGLFGGTGQPEPSRAAPIAASMQAASQAPPGNSTHFGRGTPAQAGRGQGFLAGAAQTAMGVAGGVLIGSMLGSALGNVFGGAGADKADASPTAEPETLASNDDASADADADFSGDFGDVET